MNFRFLDRLQPLALLVLRLVLGTVMIAHGYHKVFGGMSKHVALVASLGMPGWLAYLSACAEFLGGMLVLVGLFTQVAALAICIDLMVAVIKVHLHQGLIGGYEFPLSLAAMAFTLFILGSGPISIDWVVGGSGGSKR